MRQQQNNLEYMRMCNKADELKESIGSIGPWSFDELELHLTQGNFNRCHLENTLFNLQSLLGKTYPEINSAKKLMLCFVMSEKYNKHWNGADWIQER